MNAEKELNRSAEREPGLTPEQLVRVFSVLAHDLKSPIFSIDGFSELLQSDYAERLDDDGRDFLSRIRSSVAQMKRVLDQMSSVVKLLSRPNLPQKIELREIMEEVRLRLANLLDEGGVALNVPDDLPAVEADPEKLREAVAALVCNAAVFNDRPAGERRIDVTSEIRDGECVLCIADNGIGVDPRYADQIFELGLKLDKQRGIGPGYGLFVARRVAESHGGRITLESVPGEGSRFCLVLPLPPR